MLNSKEWQRAFAQMKVECLKQRQNEIQAALYKGHTRGGGGTPIYGLYRYVRRNRVWFLRFLVLK